MSPLCPKRPGDPIKPGSPFKPGKPSSPGSPGLPAGPSGPCQLMEPIQVSKKVVQAKRIDIQQSGTTDQTEHHYNLHISVFVSGLVTRILSTSLPTLQFSTTTF